MSEIPKLRYCGMIECELDDIDCDCEYKDDIGLITCLSKKSLQEVNNFWDKYKNNSQLFKRDYVKEYDLFCQSKYDYFNDWLYDLLFKVE